MITAFTVVHNEAERIGVWIDEIEPYVDEVFIVNQESTDLTVERIQDRIKRSGKITLVDDVKSGYCETSYPKFIPQTKGDWVLLMFPDEYLDPMFKVRMRLMEHLDRADFYVTPRITYMGHRGVVDERPKVEFIRRFFKKDFAIIPNGLHTEPYPVPGSRIECPDTIAMFSFKTDAEQNADTERYTSLGWVRPPEP